MSTEAAPAAIGEIAASLQTFAARHLVHSLLAAEALGLTPTDLVGMCLLQLHGPATPGWLAEMTALSTGAVTGMVDRLERAGYVTRAQDPHDPRRPNRRAGPSGGGADRTARPAVTVPRSPGITEGTPAGHQHKPPATNTPRHRRTRIPPSPAR